MKKVLIIASAVLFAASTTILAQNVTTKSQPQKAANTAIKQEPAKQEAQKQPVKTEAKVATTETKTTATTANAKVIKKHHRKGMKTAAKPAETQKK